jgi:alkyl sulfatase BDS1-like metallo-beta-lactamase superfamily hydrolase
VVNHIVFADPNNKAAKDLQADALEQLGYQAESGPWRNFLLDRRQGVAGRDRQVADAEHGKCRHGQGHDTRDVFDYLSVRIDRTRAADASMLLNVEFGDAGGKYLLEMENGVLNHTAGRHSDEADATVALSRETLNKIILRQTKLADAVQSGDAKITGNQAKLEQLVSSLDNFEFWFNIVTP